MAEEYIRVILSDNLKKLRNRREWSQMELAERANISTNFLSEIERGLKWPYPGTLQNLAGALDVEVFELFQPQGGGTEKAGIRKYMDQFSNDVLIAVEESVRKSLAHVRRQYRR
jgi:transcriptional regulator with XRE-family HTH domain